MTPSLKALMEKASQAYYNGKPFLTNEEYDFLFGDSGGVGSGESGDFPHLRPMYSLQKWYPEDDPVYPLKGHTTIVTPKYDGAAISLLFSDRQLVRALTRGDGKYGKDITEKVQYLIPVLGEPKDPDCLQITGEIVTTKSVTNARNFAAGALALKSCDEFFDRVVEGGLRFVAYNIELPSGRYTDYFSWDLELLKEWGFTTVVDDNLLQGAPTDGLVHRIDSNIRFYELGFTAKFPRGALAEKSRDTPVITKLLDVVWQTGKSGKVTPVAILEPVVIDDATITRATLNNMAYITALNLEIGCDVKVIRAGKIIPCVVGRA